MIGQRDDVQTGIGEDIDERHRIVAPIAVVAMEMEVAEHALAPRAHERAYAPPKRRWRRWNSMMASAKWARVNSGQYTSVTQSSVYAI